MRKLLLLLLLAGFTFSGISKELIIHFNHKVNGMAYVDGQMYDDGSGNKFKINKAQMLFSRIRVYHDGGSIMTFTGKEDYIFLTLDGSEISLGEQTFTKIDSLVIDFGIDSVTNHSNPALFAMDHPLAIAFGMDQHWGWAAGYKFAIVEGEYDKSGTGSIDGAFGFHAIGDYYRQTLTFKTGGVEISGKQVLIVDVNYERFFNGIDITTMGVKHGGDPSLPGEPITKAMVNIGTEPVFETSTTTVGFEAVHAEAEFEISPNLVSDRVNIVPATDVDYMIQIYSSTGSLVAETGWKNGSIDVEINASAGIYFVKLTPKEGSPGVERIVVMD